MELFKITESSLSNHKISVWTLWTPWPHLILRPRCLGAHRWVQAQICYSNKRRWVLLIGSSQIKIFEWVEVVHLTARCHFCDGSISENVQGPRLYNCTKFHAFMNKWTIILTNNNNNNNNNNNRFNLYSTFQGTQGTKYHLNYLSSLVFKYFCRILRFLCSFYYCSMYLSWHDQTRGCGMLL